MVTVVKNPASNDVAATPLDESDPLAPVTRATKDAAVATQAVNDSLRFVGSQIVRIEAQAAPATFVSQHPKLRVRAVILNTLTAQLVTLNVGTASYPFQLDANACLVIPFPLVIERGIDLSFAAADGRCYLIGDPE